MPDTREIHDTAEAIFESSRETIFALITDIDRLPSGTQPSRR
jgi:hypothetical protein